MRRIIPYYILREMVPSFVITILVMTFILLMAKVLELTELVVVKGIRPGVIFNLLALSMPYFLSLTTPMATLLAVLLAFLRLSGDNEITVLKSAGVGLYQLLPPVILFCLWTCLLTLFFSLYLVPASNRGFRNELLALAKVRADVGIKERVFNVAFNNMVLFVNHIPLGSDMMEDLFIQDQRDPDMISVIIASRGRIATDTKHRDLIFQMFNGVIDRMNRSQETTYTISFDKYELKLNLGSGEGPGAFLKRDQYEMPLEELWRAADRLKQKGDRKYAAYLMEAHRRLSLPFACLVLGLVAVPLGIRFRGRGRNWGVTLGLIIFLIYYLMLTIGRSFMDSVYYPPVVGMWMPNLVIGAAALFLLRRTNNETPLELAGIKKLLGIGRKNKA